MTNLSEIQECSRCLEGEIGCDETWLLWLVFDGIFKPSIAFVATLIYASLLGHVHRAIQKAEQQDSNFSLRLLTCLRNLAAGGVAYSAGRVAAIIKQESGFFRYYGPLGQIYCYLAMLVTFYNNVATTFIEIYFTFFVCEEVTRSIFFKKPIFPWASNTLTVIIVLFLAVSYTLAKTATLICRQCSRSGFGLSGYLNFFELSDRHPSDFGQIILSIGKIENLILFSLLSALILLSLVSFVAKLWKKGLRSALIDKSRSRKLFIVTTLIFIAHRWHHHLGRTVKLVIAEDSNAYVGICFDSSLSIATCYYDVVLYQFEQIIAIIAAIEFCIELESENYTLVSSALNTF